MNAAAPGLPDLRALPDVREAVAADSRGRLLQTTGDEAAAARCAQQTAALLGELDVLGREVGLERLDSVVVKGPSRTVVTAVRPGAFVRVTLDTAQGTVRIERALGEWRPAGAVAPAAPDAPAEPFPASAEGCEQDDAVRAVDLGASVLEAAARAAPAAEPWGELRRKLVRGQLTDASVMRTELSQAAAEPRAGAEPLDDAVRERALDGLLEGIGSILSGDALGGVRTLKPFTSPPHPNLSVCWLSMHWSALAALRCNGTAAARWYARESLVAARRLDADAQATSRWAAAEVLAAEGDLARALAWVGEARIRFEQLRDPWGLARVCFGEARILAAMQREGEAVEAAQRAWVHDPGWDEPLVFLALRALQRGAVGEAEAEVHSVATVAGERVRSLVEAIRRGTVSQADAAEVLRLRDSPPTEDSLRALERIARTAPDLALARETLAWMLLKAGRYASAGTLFQGLATARLTPAVRSSVMLGLGCVAAHTGDSPEARPAAAQAGGGGASAEEAPRPSSSSPAGLAGAAGAVFSGNLSVFAVPDLLEFLRGARRTGVLQCSSGAGTAALRFRDGRITGATSSAPPRVGELLVRARKLSPAVLQAALDRAPSQPGSDGVLGEMLVREGLVDADAVQEALREQIALTVKEIVLWRDGEFAFDRHEGEDGMRELPVEVDPQQVLLNALRELDEASRTRSPS